MQTWGTPTRHRVPTRIYLETEVTLLGAWMFLTRCSQSLAKHMTTKAAAADMLALMLSELYQIVAKEWGTTKSITQP